MISILHVTAHDERQTHLCADLYEAADILYCASRRLGATVAVDECGQRWSYMELIGGGFSDRCTVGEMITAKQCSPSSAKFSEPK